MKFIKIAHTTFAYIPLLFIFSLYLFYYRAAMDLGHLPTLPNENSGIFDFKTHRNITLLLMKVGFYSLIICLFLTLYFRIFKKSYRFNRILVVALLISLLLWLFVFYIDPFDILGWFLD